MATKTPHFSKRQREVLTLVARGEPQKAIAATLGIGLSTVSFHIEEAGRKMGRRLGVALCARLAVSQGWVAAEV